MTHRLFAAVPGRKSGVSVQSSDLLIAYGGWRSAEYDARAEYLRGKPFP